MDLIDVTVVGGPDVRAAVERAALPGGTAVTIRLVNDSSVPARVQRVAAVVECPPASRVRTVGWAHDDAGTDGPPAAAPPGALAVITPAGALGWLGANVHRGEVAIRPEGWLLTAWADMAGLILWPGEAAILDRLWVGSPDGDPGRRWAEAWRSTAAIAVRDIPPTCLLVDGAGHECPGRRGVRIPGEGAVVDLPAGDLSRPEAHAEAHDAGRSHRDAAWVVLRGAGQQPADAWGGGAVTPVAALRAVLVAWRAGLGPSPVLHVRGAPPAVAAGVADVVDNRHPDLDGLLWVSSPPTHP